MNMDESQCSFKRADEQGSGSAPRRARSKGEGPSPSAPTIPPDPPLAAVAAASEGRVLDVRMIATSAIAPSSLGLPLRYPDPELCASVRDHGVIEPLIVRPVPPELRALVNADFEYVAGQRRWRAAIAEQIELVPCEVRELSDAEALDLATEENLHRAAFTPMQEAAVFQAHRTRSMREIVQIAAKVHKSEGYVTSRLKLLDLPPEAQRALEDELLLLGVAIEIACLSPDQRGEAFELVKAPAGGSPRTLREARDLLAVKFHLRLANAPFDLDDAELAPRGACTPCPLRSGNQLALLAVGIDQDDRCLERACYERKVEAAWQRRRAEAQARGAVALDMKAGGREAEEAHVLVRHPDRRGMVNLDASCGLPTREIDEAEDALEAAKAAKDPAGVEDADTKLAEVERRVLNRPWRKILAEYGVEVPAPAAIVRDARPGPVVELAPEREVLAQLEEAGCELPDWARDKLLKPPPVEAPAPATTVAEWQVRHRAAELLGVRLVEAVVPKAAGTPARPGPAFWRACIAGLADGLDHEPIEKTAERHGWAAAKGQSMREAIPRQAKELPEPQLRALFVEILCWSHPRAARAMAEALGVKVKSIEAECRKKAASELAEEATKKGGAAAAKATRKKGAS